MTRPCSLPLTSLRGITATTLFAIALTGTQATASTLPLPGLETPPRKVAKLQVTIGGIDYAAFEDSTTRAETIQLLLDRQASGTPYVPPTFPTTGTGNTTDTGEINLYFEAQLSFGMASARIGFQSAPNEISDDVTEALSPGKKVTGRLTYKPNTNFYVEQVASDPELAGLSTDEIDALVGIGQYELSEASLTFDRVGDMTAVTKAFIPTGQFGEGATEDEQRAFRSVNFGNNTLFGDEFVRATAIAQGASILPTLVNTPIYQSLDACGSHYASQALAGAFVTPETRAYGIMGLNLSGPDILSGNDRQPSQPVVTQDKILTGNTFAFSWLEYESQLTYSMSEGTCDDLLANFKRYAAIAKTYTAVGSITYLSPFRLNAPSLTPGIPIAPPVSAVPVPPALGFGLTGLLLLGALRRFRSS